MAYPPRSVISPEAAAPQGRTPGFAPPTAAVKVVRARVVGDTAATTRFNSPAPAPIRRAAARPTPANESADKKTG